MSMAPWPEPIVAAADAAAVAALRGLWAEADRVDGAVADSNRLLGLLGDTGRGGPRAVHVITVAAPHTARPGGWRWTWVRETPTPEFLLFYRAGTAFPESAIVFSGGSRDGWLTSHRRPLVLHRLRERFEALAAGRGPEVPLAAASIREQERERPARCRAPTAADAGPELVVPRELYGRVLSAHFADLGPQDDRAARPRAAPDLAAHQERAYERASAILDRYGGVIVADAVGLGKTYIGLRLLERALAAGGRGLVIVPASLRDQWAKELSYLGISGAATTGSRRTNGTNTDDNLDLWVQESGQGRVELLSMESLGRRSFDPIAQRGADLVLVDEAHNFRNPATRRYRNLADLLRYSKVALLTATPINNTLLDLQHLIDLFAAPGAFRHLGIPDYREAFRAAAAGDGDLRAIISACVLRRTRRFLRAHYGDIRVRAPGNGHEFELRFPRRRRPIPVEYDLASTYGDLFAGLDAWLEELRFPAIEPEAGDAEPAEPLSGPGALLKIILLKRLESSIEAFRCTVIQQLAWCNTALRAIDAGRVLTRPDYRASFRGPADDPGSQLAFFELMLPAPSIAPERLAQLRRSLELDAAILAHIHAALVAIGPAGDRKLARLVELLDGPLAGRKLLLFTEFRDTARYLHHQLRMRPHIALIDSAGARLGLERAGRREVIERFAPRSNGLAEPPARERVDLLIATDVLSEGLNLQDASVVVSYDLPWNPVRLMQRIGRIDRLGAVSDEVELHHFVPAHELDRLLGLMARLQGKISAISANLGLDGPVLTAAAERERAVEQIRALARDPQGYDRLEEEVEGPLDPEEQAYLDYVAGFRAGRPPPPGAPAACAVTRHGETTPRAVAYWRVSCGGQARGLWLIAELETGCVVEDPVAALELFRTARTLWKREPPQWLLAAARHACASHARGVLARLEATRVAGDALNPGLPQCRIAAWLSRCFRSTAHQLAPEERETIDRLLDGLARRYTIAGERCLYELAVKLPDRLDRSILERLQSLLGELASDGDGATQLREVGTLLLLGRL